MVPADASCRRTCSPGRHPRVCHWARCWATFGAIRDIQTTFGEDACHRYVISFTRGAQDVLDVLRLAAVADGPRTLDVVPLFESADALADCETDHRPAAVRPGVP